jgi:hypothetical protein
VSDVKQRTEVRELDKVSKIATQHGVYKLTAAILCNVLISTGESVLMSKLRQGKGIPCLKTVGTFVFLFLFPLCVTRKRKLHSGNIKYFG